MKHLFKRIKKNLVNIPGWITNKKIIVIESDDWGSISMPSLSVYKKLLASGVPVDQNLFTQFDSLESEEDLDELFNVLTKYQDCKGNHPCITACSVVANPDFEKIAASDFQEYHYEPITETYQRYPNHAKSFEIWKEGIDAHILWPQFHGREHLNPKEWLKVLRTGDKHERLAFDEKALLAITKHHSSKRFMGYLAAFDYETGEELEEFEQVIHEGQKLFETLFGFKSLSFVAPTGIRSDRLDKYLAANGIEYHQVGQQFLPYSEARFAIRNRLMGSINQYGQRYWRRNGTFEPSRNWNFDWVASALEEMKYAFRWNKPYVISSHRVNYIGNINKRNREVCLNMLDELLKKILSLYPDVEFMSSDQLGIEMSTNPAYFMGVAPANFYYDRKYTSKKA